MRKTWCYRCRALGGRLTKPRWWRCVMQRGWMDGSLCTDGTSDNCTYTRPRNHHTRSLSDVRVKAADDDVDIGPLEALQTAILVRVCVYSLC